MGGPQLLLFFVPSSWPLPASPHLTQPPLLLLYIFFLPSSWSHPESVHYSASVVPDIEFLHGWASASVILFFTLFLTSTRIFASTRLCYYFYYFTYSVYILLGLTLGLCVIYPQLFFFDFILTSPWVFAGVGLSFCYSFYPLLGLYPNLSVAQPPLLLFHIFCLPSSWSHPKSVRYLSSIVFFISF